MKKIIFLADFPPIVGGTTIWYFKICEQLLGKGFALYTLGGRGNPPKGVIDLNPHQKLPKVLRLFAFAIDVCLEAFVQRKVLTVLFRNGLLRLSDWAKLASYLSLMKRAHGGIPPEGGIIFAAHANFNSLLAYLLCRKYGNFKLVIRCHGAGVLEFFERRPRLVRFLLSNADFINCVSQFIATECRKKGARPERLAVVLSARDVHSLANTRSLHKQETVTFCGFLEPRKDPMTFAKAIKELIDLKMIRDNVRFLFIGDGSLRAQLQRFCGDNNLERIVRFTGIVPIERVWQHLGASKVLVLPSVREPSGAVLIEAMASRCYCIAANVGGIPELVTPERGGLFEPGDYKALAKLISEFFRDEKEHVKKVENAFAHVIKDYSFERAADQLEAIFTMIG